MSPEPPLMAMSAPDVPEMLPLEALNVVAPFELRLMPARVAPGGDTVSHARPEAPFTLSTRTGVPPLTLPFSVEPEPTLIVGAPDAFTRNPVPLFVVMV